MTAPKRIQRKRTKGYRLPPDAIYVGRPGRFGNAHRIGDDYLFVDEMWVRSPHDRGDRTIDNRADLVKAYRQDVGLCEPQEIAEWIVAPLRGHDLACWCPLDQPCHADVLLELANR